MKITYRIAHSLGTDAANRQMRQNGRTIWYKEGFNLAQTRSESTFRSASK